MIVERLSDGGVFATEWAIGIAFDFDLPESGGEGTVVNEASERGPANSGKELDRFHGLEASNDSREHAQDTGFSSCGDCSFRRGFGEEAAVARASEVWGEDGDLAFELEDGAMYEGLFEEVGGVVGREACREIVRAIKDGIVGGEEVETVMGFETAGVRDDFDVRINLLKARACTLDFRGADTVGIVEDLAMKI